MYHVLCTVIQNEIQVFHHMGVEVPEARIYAYGYYYPYIQLITIFYFRHATDYRTGVRILE